MQTGLEGKPWFYGAGAGLLVAGAIYFAANIWLLKPQREGIERQESKLAGLQAKIQAGRAAKQQLPRFREEVQRLELELDKLLRILPSRRNTPELLRRIRALTEQGDFELLKFTPGGFIDRDFYVEWPITINLDGGYHNLALLFDRIGRFSRIINIEKLRVNAARDAEAAQTISASFNATTFIYKDLEEE